MLSGRRNPATGFKLEIIKLGIVMKTEVKNTLKREFVQGEYVTPEAKVLNLQPEGIFCSSHGGFGFDETEDL